MKFHKFIQKVLQWFNSTNNSSFTLATEEILFDLPNKPNDELKRNLNYTLLYMCYYIYKMKLQNDSLSISDFINKIIYKYRIEHLLSYLRLLLCVFDSFFILFRERFPPLFILICYIYDPLPLPFLCIVSSIL